MRGQFITGRNAGADKLSVSPSKFYRGLQQLERMGCLTLKANSNWTTVTISKYSTYQDKREKSEQQVNSERTGRDTSSDTTNEQRMNTNKKERIKEGEEGKKENTSLSPSGDVDAGIHFPEFFEQFWSVYPKRDGKRRGKRKAFNIWKTIPASDRNLVIEAAKNYQTEEYIRDPERFLASDWWRDWIDPAEPQEQPLDRPQCVEGDEFDYLSYSATFDRQ